jgi:hypothetical protein
MHGNINGPSQTAGMTGAGLGIVVISLLADVTVAVIKFTVAYISGSTAMMRRTEVNLLYGLIMSGREASPESTSSAMAA